MQQLQLHFNIEVVPARLGKVSLTGTSRPRIAVDLTPFLPLDDPIGAGEEEDESDDDERAVDPRRVVDVRSYFDLRLLSAVRRARVDEGAHAFDVHNDS